MKILIVGSGGREHAVTWKVVKSPLVQKTFVAPGNAGIADLAECVDIKPDDIEGLLAFARREHIDLTIVGPESPLVAGIVDRFRSEGLKIFGPEKAAAELEGSKVFSKSIMKKFGVPTAEYRVFESVNDAKQYIVECEPPIVVKADGLAAGKGVLVCGSAEEGVCAVNDLIEQRIFGEAGKRVVIEQHLRGEELSILAFTDGKQILPLASAQDHKRVFDDDRGPNTGGMGAYSPCPLVHENQIGTVVEKTIRPVIDGLRREGILYTGVIYAGLMMTEKGPFVLEYNCRFGDPETQAILPRLKDDIVPVFLQVAEKDLGQRTLEWDSRACVSVVMASGGYPGAYKKGFIIKGLDELKHKRDVIVFHAGTSRGAERQYLTDGGRVLAVSALGADVREARERAYQTVDIIFFREAHYRKDIGLKALKQGEAVRP
ncbi:MAG: phosphoribosylamine--glycine ligase [Candidatus Omnitrophica bacterium]|nr:phosphoribosylamine--glycine ligase [Candidatus Omnitrophota bacterium]